MLQAQFGGENAVDPTAEAKAAADLQQVIAASCDTEAEACLKRRDYKKALEHYEAALKTRKALYGTKPHVALAETHSALGQVHLTQQNYAAAEEHLRTAYEIYSTCLGADHATTQQAEKALENVFICFSEQS
ncbi:MAG: tetratricopeptide repeat protein [Bacteroidota bacterium]